MMLQHFVYLALGLLALCAIESWVFVIRYSRVRWYASPEGRQLMQSHVVLALLFSMTLLFQVVEPRPVTALTLSIGLFGWTAFGLGNLIRLQWKAQRESRNRKPNNIGDTH